LILDFITYIAVQCFLRSFTKYSSYSQPTHSFSGSLHSFSLLTLHIIRTPAAVEIVFADQAYLALLAGLCCTRFRRRYDIRTLNLSSSLLIHGVTVTSFCLLVTDSILRGKCALAVWRCKPMPANCCRHYGVTFFIDFCIFTLLLVYSIVSCPSPMATHWRTQRVG